VDPKEWLSEARNIVVRRGVRFEFTTDPQDLDGTFVKDA
jgi:hypothetical protein